MKVDFFLWKNKNSILKCLGGFLILVVLAGYSFYTYKNLSDVLKKDNTFILNLFTGLCAWMLFFIVFLYYCVNKKKHLSIEKAFVISMFFLGFSYLIATPAFSVPDELVHYGTSYRLSNQLMGIKDTNEDYALCRSCDTAPEITHITTLQTYKYFYNNVFKKPLENDEVVNSPEVIKHISVISHLPQAIGITIARLFHFSYAGLLYTGQFFTLIAYTLLTYFAIKIIPFGKNILFVISGFPIVLHEATSYSYDAIVYGLSFLLIAYIINLVYVEKRITIKHCVVSFIIAMALAPCKMIYAFITLLVILIPNKKFKDKWYARVYKFFMIVCSVLYAFISNMGEVSNTSSGKHIVEWAGEEGYTVSYVFHHISGIIKLYVATFHEQMGYYLDGMLGGLLGWLNIDIPVELTMCSLVLLVLSIREERKYNIKLTHSLLYIADFFFISLLACATMLLAWTPLSYPFIAGVQGRYFIPVLPLFLLPFIDATKEQEECTRKVLIIGNCIVNYLVILRIIEINVMR
ncbi:MAG: DUF2142 domain-containing protein [Lachnospiraceae bacterium]|nr:DUF2142 domain-containing protein [Lachnospiraceae bacterium]